MDAKRRKEQKYIEIERKASNMLRKNQEYLRQNMQFDRYEVITNYIVVSSLGVIPKDTYKEIRRITKVRDS
jgi:hypothetical protein